MVRDQKEGKVSTEHGRVTLSMRSNRSEWTRPWGPKKLVDVAGELLSKKHGALDTCFTSVRQQPQHESGTPSAATESPNRLSRGIGPPSEA